MFALQTVYDGHMMYLLLGIFVWWSGDFILAGLEDTSRYRPTMSYVRPYLRRGRHHV